MKFHVKQQRLRRAATKDSDYLNGQSITSSMMLLD